MRWKAADCVSQRIKCFLRSKNHRQRYVFLLYVFLLVSRVFCFNNDKPFDVCLHQVLLLLFLTASSDTGPNICSSVLGCCNKTIENGMKSQITKEIMNLTHWRNERAIRQFEGVYDDLEGMTQL